MIDGEGTGTRPETGPMCFGDDWPGVFIRGDDAYAFLIHLKQFMDLHPKTEDDAILRSLIEQLMGLLHSAILGQKHPGLPLLKLKVQHLKEFTEAKLPKRSV